MKKFLFLFFFLFPMIVYAQWKVGLMGGADFNSYTSDEHYLTDFQTKGRWGTTFGIVVQRNLVSWAFLGSKIGVRSGINWTNKNYLTIKDGNFGTTMITHNCNYLQLPIMATYSVGGEMFRTFINLGGYSGWRKSDEWRRSCDLGGVGGLGLEWNFCLKTWKNYSHFTLQAEARCYLGAQSVTKTDRKFETPHYNTTTALQITLFYNFK